VLAAGWHDMPRVSRELTFDRGQNQTKQAAFSRVSLPLEVAIRFFAK